MRGLTASDVLEVWERGRAGGGTERALLMLSAAVPDSSPDDFAGISVGRRNALLLRLREQTFGQALDGIVACLGCSETLEISFSVGVVAVDSSAEPDTWHDVDIDGLAIRYRLPTSRDLFSIESLDDPVAAGRSLIERCVEIRVAPRHRSRRRLSLSALEQVGDEMAARDPGAVADLRLSCPACGHDSVVSFDIASFLWAEIEGKAPRLLLEVHELASAYGWAEAEILALSPWRRSFYRAMAAKDLPQ
jgi:hypothetical protein